jgi:hypothetical protein
MARPPCPPWHGLIRFDRGLCDVRLRQRLVPKSSILVEVRRLRARGYALISICETLNEQGLRNRRGGLFKPSHIGQLLDRHPAKIP